MTTAAIKKTQLKDCSREHLQFPNRMSEKRFLANTFLSYSQSCHLFNHFHHNRETGCGGGRTTERGSKLSGPFYPPNHDIAQKTDHNTGNYMPYSLRQVCGFFYVPQGCESGPTVYRPYPRRLESLTICRCNYIGSTFSSVI